LAQAGTSVPQLSGAIEGKSRSGTTLGHWYHDEDPVQRAEFSVTFVNGLVVAGQFDAEGKAQADRPGDPELSAAMAAQKAS
jgi:hypothetical protein